MRQFDSIAVAIPARDEIKHIEACLHAIANQTGAQATHIVLCANNTTDGTPQAARRVTLPIGTTLHILEKTFAPHEANAGHARRLAMNVAAGLAGDGGIVMTTDADAVVDPDWIAANLAALRQGADAVAGWVDLDPDDWHRIPMKLHEADALECAYDDLCDEIHARLDPDPADPMPRHTQHSGASIAATVRAYRAAGGIPAIPTGEDRAFFAALRRIDARIRHSPACHVSVSGRLEGRAEGGMAATIRRRLECPDRFLDDRLEPAEDCARRARLRQLLRACLADPSRLPEFAKAAGLPDAYLRERLCQSGLGVLWAEIEGSSPRLRRRRVAVEDLPRQMARAQQICLQLRESAALVAAPARLVEAA